MSHGDDIAHAIALLAGNRAALGEAIHIAGAKSVTWSEVNNIYVSVLEDQFHRRPEFMYVDDWEKIGKALGRCYQLKYARAVSRRFNNSKLERLIGKIVFADSEVGLGKCLNQFLNGDNRFKSANWKAEAYYNRITKDKNTEFAGKARLKYHREIYTIF